MWRWTVVDEFIFNSLSVFNLWPRNRQKDARYEWWSKKPVKSCKICISSSQLTDWRQSRSCFPSSQRSLGILCSMKGLAKRRECLNDYILPVLVPIFDLCLMPLIIVIFSYFHCSAPSNFPSIIMDQEVVGNSRKLLNTLDDSSDWFLPLKFRHSDEPTSRWGTWMLSQGIDIVHLQTQVPRISTQSNIDLR